MNDLNAFKKNVDLYSGDLARWPVGLVKQALAMMEASAEAKAYFEQAISLDNLLRSAAPKERSYAALEARIMQRISSTAQGMPQSSFPFKPSYLFAPGGGLLAAVLIGFFIGLQPPAQADYTLDPIFYAEEQIIGEDEDLFNDEVF